jgi:hypothetical protein
MYSNSNDVYMLSDATVKNICPAIFAGTDNLGYILSLDHVRALDRICITMNNDEGMAREVDTMQIVRDGTNQAMNSCRQQLDASPVTNLTTTTHILHWINFQDILCHGTPTQVCYPLDRTAVALAHFY